MADREKPTLDAPAPTDPAPYALPIGHGKSIHIAEEGAGPLVMMLHGVPGSLRDFRYLGPALAARGMRAVRIDFPGFGQTPFDAFPAFKASNRAALFVHIADALGAETFSVIGHSFGGAACFFAAAQFEHRVRALGLISSLGVVRHRGFSPVPPPMMRLLARAARVPALAARMEGPANALYAGMGFKGTFSIEEMALHAQLVAAVDFKEHRQVLRKVRCPVLIASAEDDPLVDARAQHKLADAFSDRVYLRHVHTREGGHYLQKFAAHPLAAHFADIVARAQHARFADAA